MEYNGHYYKLVLQRNFIDCTAKLLYVSFVESIKLATDAVDQYNNAVPQPPNSSLDFPILYMNSWTY